MSFDTVSMEVYPLSETRGDSKSVGCPHLYVTLPSSTETTDFGGTYMAPGVAQVAAKLKGEFADVSNRRPGPPRLEYAGHPTFDWNRALGITCSDNRFRDINAYYHVTRARVLAERSAPPHRRALLARLLRDVKVVVDRDEIEPALRGTWRDRSQNAWWDRELEQIQFGSKVRYALDSLVIFHEYAHGIIDKITDESHFPLVYEPGHQMENYLPTAVCEAFADYLACTLADWPIVLEGTRAARNLSTPTIFNSIPVGDPHAYSLSLSSGLWELRQSNLVGREVADLWVWETLFELRKSPHRLRSFGLHEAVNELIQRDRQLTARKHASHIVNVFRARALLS